MIIEYEPKITKDYLLERASQETYLEYYLGIPVKKGLYRSPLRKDDKPTCSFYRNKNGDIILDASLLDYSFDNELFLIFIDGHKIIKDDIQNISSNRVRIKNRIEWESICICKYLNPDRILQKVFSYGDHWTKSIEGLSEDDYEQLFIKSGVKR